MNEHDEREQAAQALATVQAHQHRAQRAARLPWWVYVAVFLLCAAGSAANDVLSLTGAKVFAVAILVIFALTLLIGAVGRSAPLSWTRGVQPRQTFVPSAFLAVAVIGGVGVWLISTYGTALAHTLANAVGLPHYPNTVIGVVYGLVFTAVFALGQFLVNAAQRRSAR